MKTDTVEIFQSVRAVLQPFTTKGFTSRTNSEDFYDLWSDKQFDDSGSKIEVAVFATLAIKDGKVELCLMEESGDSKCATIGNLDDDVLSSINVDLEIAYTKCKQNGWV